MNLAMTDKVQMIDEYIQKLIKAVDSNDVSTAKKLQNEKIILKKVNNLTEEELKARIESHCINYDALVSDDFDTYFIDRAKKLLNLIEAAMGKPVADRSAEITIEQFGASLT